MISQDARGIGWTETYGDVSCSTSGGCIAQETKDRVRDCIRVVELKASADNGENLLVRVLYP